ncbi:12135_t:CDS:2 [Funneliformis mosseae]|uniref:12135_t:CDS:1 n=1 Tax=Funneliformis mosseae TaxID=27381 RepID=A0A9N9F515_FUNMO|nr:12135_t:CDS:2 [Funneliformis mosseae]
MLLVGSLALVSYLRVCKAMILNTGIFDYRIFLFPAFLPALLSIPAWPSFGGDGYWCFQNRESAFIPLSLLYADILILMTSLFCYIGIVHAINVSRFRNDQENFCTANKKIIGYLFTYILQWTPVMIYIITDIERQANMWVFAICITSLPIGGILKTYQYISNEGWWSVDSIDERRHITN